jgi:hypothetical protein
MATDRWKPSDVPIIEHPASPPAEQPLLWSDKHIRVTFHCPKDLLGHVTAEMQSTGRSKTRVIVEALVEHFRRTKAIP